MSISISAITTFSNVISLISRTLTRRTRQSHPRILDEFLGSGKLCDHIGICSDFCVVPFHVDNSRTFELGGCDLLREGQGPIVEGTRPLFTDPEKFDILESGESIRDD